MQELQADAKLVYNGTLNDLVALATKYNVSTIRTKMIVSGEINVENYASIGVAAFPTKGDQKAIRSSLYATIKGQMR